MKILISGSSSGIGLATSKKYLELGHEVYGLDLNASSINDPHYHHYIVDIKSFKNLPDIEDVEILFNNAGSQNSKNDIRNNLEGTINVTEKYAFNPSIKSVLFNASASNQTGDEFPLYVASKAGIVGYMKNVAMRLAKNHATVNSISLGGVITSSNLAVLDNKELWEEVMKVTPLEKWMTLDEVVDWVIFLTLKNKSMSGQDLLIDNGEKDLNSTFIWPTNHK